MGNAGAKSARLDFRVPRHIHRTIKQAAAISGISVTDFLTACAYDTALKIVRDHDDLVLRGRDREVFLAALANPPRANKALRSLLRRARPLRML